MFIRRPEEAAYAATAPWPQHGLGCSCRRVKYVHVVQTVQTVQYSTDSTVQYGTSQYDKTQTVQYSTIKYSAVQYSKIQYRAVNSVRHGTTRDVTVQVVQCSAVQCSAMLRNATLDTTQHSTLRYASRGDATLRCGIHVRTVCSQIAPRKSDFLGAVGASRMASRLSRLVPSPALPSGSLPSAGQQREQGKQQEKAGVGAANREVQWETRAQKGGSYGGLHKSKDRQRGPVAGIPQAILRTCFQAASVSQQFVDPQIDAHLSWEL